MGRPSLPSSLQQKIRELNYSGQSQRSISRALNLSRLSVERVLFPDRLKRRDIKHRKPCARIVKLDREETPAGCFNVNDYSNWMIG